MHSNMHQELFRSIISQGATRDGKCVHIQYNTHACVHQFLTYPSQACVCICTATNRGAVHITPGCRVFKIPQQVDTHKAKAPAAHKYILFSDTHRRRAHSLNTQTCTVCTACSIRQPITSSTSMSSLNLSVPPLKHPCSLESLLSPS